MKKSKLFRTLTLAVAAALCMATTTVTAYAGGADPDPVPLPEITEAPAEVPEETEEPTTGGMEPEGVPLSLIHILSEIPALILTRCSPIWKAVLKQWTSGRCWACGSRHLLWG